MRPGGATGTGAGGSTGGQRRRGAAGLAAHDRDGGRLPARMFVQPERQEELPLQARTGPEQPLQLAPLEHLEGVGRPRDPEGDPAIRADVETAGGLDVALAADLEAGHLHPVLVRSEEHTSELQSPYDLVCRLLVENKKQYE